ncbi:MAG: hypothetical protein RLZZ244_210 [Verrucomicrobiota bacterium]|jgi:predicted permease
MNFLQILGAVAPVFLVIGSGMFLRWVGWLRPESDQSLLKMGFQLLFPALIADTVLGNPLLARAHDVWLPPLLAFGLIALSFALTHLLLRPLQLPSASHRAGTVSAGMQNYGYLVIPLVQSLYDRETLGVLFVHNLGVDTAMWSLGVLILSGNRGQSIWRHIFSVPVIAILGSVLLNLLHGEAWIPTFVRNAMHLLGQAATPIALILTGATLYDLARQKSETPSPLAALTIALGARHLLLPLLILASAAFLPAFLPIPIALQRILVLQAAMPAAMMPVVLCKLYGSDARLSLQIILLSTALGLVTIPLWLQAAFAWLPATR